MYLESPILTTIIFLFSVGFLLLYKKIIAYARTSNDINRLDNVITFDKIDDDGKTILCLKGVARLIHVEGLDYSTFQDDDLEKSLRIRADFIKNLQGLDVNFRCFSVRKLLKLKDQEFDKNSFPGIYGEAYFKTISSSYFNTYYILISADKKNILNKACKAVENGLKDYKITEVVLDSEDYSSPLLTTLYELITGYSRNISPNKNIREALSSFSIEFDSDDLIKIEDNFQTFYRGVATIKTWGDETDVEIFNSVVEIPADITICERFYPMTSAKALFHLMQNKAQKNKIRENEIASEEFEVAIKEGQNDSTSLLKSEFSIFVTGKTKEEVFNVFAKIEKILLNKSINIIREKETAQRVFWSSFFPNFDDIWTREYYFDNENISELLPFKKDDIGFSSCDWGNSPVCYIPLAQSRSPYGLIFHESEAKEAPAHFAVFGGTGQGKTVLIEHLLTSAINSFPDLYTNAFDRDNGLRILAEVLPESEYLNANSRGFNFNPFDCKKEDKIFLEYFLTSVVAQKNDTDSALKISEALDALFSMKKLESKNIHGFLELLGDCPAKNELIKYANTERFSMLFSQERDLFNGLNAKHLFFPMDLIAGDEELAPIAMFYILNKLPKIPVSKAKPFWIIVDEAATLLKNKSMAEAVTAWIKTQRKNRGAVSLLFQEIDIFRQPHIDDTIINNLSSFFIFPNSAKSVEACQLLNLTKEETEFALGTKKMPSSRRIILLKRNRGGSVYLDVDLKPVGNLLKIFEGGSVAMSKLKAARNTFEDIENINQIDLMNAYLKESL